MKRRVQRGAAFLEAQQGPRWHEIIHIDILDISSPRCCVLGQWIGDYKRGLKKLRLNNQEACSYGFHINGDGDYLHGRNYKRNWQLLTRYWREIIQERQRHGKHSCIKA